MRRGSTWDYSSRSPRLAGWETTAARRPREGLASYPDRRQRSIPRASLLALQTTTAMKGYLIWRFEPDFSTIGLKRQSAPLCDRSFSWAPAWTRAHFACDGRMLYCTALGDRLPGTTRSKTSSSESGSG